MIGGLRKVGRSLASLLSRAESTRSLGERAESVERRQLTTDPLGPGIPVLPREARGTAPRGWIYPSGINTAQSPRTLPGLVSFQQLRNFASSYDVLRICLETRKQQIRGLKWDVVVRDPVRVRGSDFSPDIENAVAFFSHPDGRMPFGVWVGAALEDALVIDALTIYKRRDRRGRLLGLELVDGATIKPLVDTYGRPPSPPVPSYQQFAYGFPWAEFTSEELLYRPYNPRSFVNYGLSPVEQTIVTVTIALSRQVTAINHYKEGNTPAGFGEVPKEWTSEMIRQFEEMFNGLLAGDFAARARIKMVPSGFNFKPWIDSGTTFNPTYDEYLARIVCAAFGIAPTQFIRSFNRATAEAVDEASTVSGFDPLKEFVERLMDEILVAADGLNMPHLRFTFTTEKRRDEQLELQKNVEYLKAGVLSIDDVLTRLGMEPLGIGRFVNVPGKGPVALAQIFPDKLENQDQEMAGNSTAPVALSDQERADLGKWMRKAMRIMNRQNVPAPAGATRAVLSKADLEFDSGAIEPQRRSRLQASLALARTAEEVRVLFEIETKATVPDIKKSGDRRSVQNHIRQVSRALLPVMQQIQPKIAAIVLSRSGICKRGFDGQVRVSWLHDRAPEIGDLRRPRAEYFDDDDFRAMGALLDPLADALEQNTPPSAGFPLASKPLDATHLMRPGAPLCCDQTEARESTRIRVAEEVIHEAQIVARARLNALLDIAYEQDLSVIQVRDAVARATDFSVRATDAIAMRALSESLQKTP